MIFLFEQRLINVSDKHESALQALYKIKGSPKERKLPEFPYYGNDKSEYNDTAPWK